MKAAVYHGKHNLIVEEIPDKQIQDNEVLIKVKYCGVCGTDIHIYNGEGGSSNVVPPIIPGHEFSGVVTLAGKAVKNLKVGDRVCGDPNIMCGECYFCKNKMEHFCENNIGLGTTQDGAFAEYVVMKASHVYRIPDEIDFMSAAMIEPLSCCLHGIDLCNIKNGDSVLVIGGGPIGIIMLQLAKLSGASKVILSEPVKEKRELALSLGADKVIDPMTENIEEVLHGFTKNVQCVIECVGNIHTQADAIRLAGKGATVMFFGLTGPDAELTIKPDVIFKKELHITSSYINPYAFYRAIEVLASGKVDVKSIITAVEPLDKIEEVLSNPIYRKSGKVMIQMF